MADLTREEAGWALSRVWLDALEATARDFFGNRPQVFISRAYEHAAESLIRVLEQDYGIKAEEANSIKEGIEKYIELGVHGGVFADTTEFELNEVTPTTVDVTVQKCPYIDSCTHLINEGVAFTDITCARLGCFSAGAKILAQEDCHYEVNSVKLEGGCTGTIMKA